MSMSAEDIPVGQIREAALEYVDGYFSRDIVTGMYIYGSFGGRAATSDSDIDLLVVVDDEAEIDNVGDVAWVIGGGHMTFDGFILDPASCFEEDAAQLLRYACSAREYDTVFDAYELEYLSVDEL